MRVNSISPWRIDTDDRVYSGRDAGQQPAGNCWMTGRLRRGACGDAPQTASRYDNPGFGSRKTCNVRQAGWRYGGGCGSYGGVR